MLNPQVLTDAIVTTLQTISALVEAMNNDPTRIKAFHYLYGVNVKSSEAIYKLPGPSTIVMWTGTLGGNFDGMTIWKHKVDIYIRASNVAGTTPVSYEYLWWLLVNEPVNGTALNIRQIQVIEGVVDLCDTPSVSRRIDEDGMDYFVGQFVFPEIGDN